MVSEITGNLNVCSTACVACQKKKHQSSAFLALCEGNPPVTGGFPSQMESDAEIVFHVMMSYPP